jgi:hypothetical protein
VEGAAPIHPDRTAAERLGRYAARLILSREKPVEMHLRAAQGIGAVGDSASISQGKRNLHVVPVAEKMLSHRLYRFCWIPHVGSRVFFGPNELSSRWLFG